MPRSYTISKREQRRAKKAKKRRIVSAIKNNTSKILISAVAISCMFSTGIAMLSNYKISSDVNAQIAGINAKLSGLVDSQAALEKAQADQMALYEADQNAVMSESEVMQNYNAMSDTEKEQFLYELLSDKDNGIAESLGKASTKIAEEEAAAAKASEQKTNETTVKKTDTKETAATKNTAAAKTKTTTTQTVAKTVEQAPVQTSQVAEPAAEKTPAAETMQETVNNTPSESPNTEEISTLASNTEKESTWNGPVITKQSGVAYGPSGKETYYNLNMNQVIRNAKNGAVSSEYAENIQGDYWVRDDGCKMLGEYIIVAANLNEHPRGSLLETTRGTAVVLDTGGFTTNGSGVSVDIATAW